MTYHHGWLWLVQPNGVARELFNHARTAAYLRNSPTLGCARVSNILDDGGCRAYRYAPPCEAWGDTSWTLQTYSTPQLDNAPWYNDAYPESTQALGFWVSEWTGLDSGHITRGVTPVSAFRGGGQMGAVSSRQREMALEVILLGTSEKSLEYLFRWLEATLSSVCATCETNTVLLRRYCPDDLSEAKVSDGVVEMREVGLTSGLTWGGPISNHEECYLRRVSFTLAAGDPCMYSAETQEIADSTMTVATCISDAGLSMSRTRTSCRPGCAELPTACRTTFDFIVDTVGAAAPHVVLENTSSTQYTLPVRIKGMGNPLGLSDPCGLPLLGEMHVAALPPNSKFVWDVAGRDVLYWDATTGGYVSGYPYVETNNVGVPRFFGMGCGRMKVTVEINEFCLGPSDGVYLDANGFSYGATPIAPTATLYVQERLGCA